MSYQISDKQEVVINRPLISVVSPVYKGEKLVPLLVEQVKNELQKITDNFEIILVEDGSNDKGWDQIVEEGKRDSRVKGILLSRNFGQHYAITAGLDKVRGEWVVVMDCDLQDRPSEIPKLFEKAKEGYDIVLARRENRNDKYAKKLFSVLFYKALGYLSGTKQDPSVANFGIYHINVINAVRSMREPIRYFPTMIRWVGFKRTSIAVEHSAREIGSSSYNFRRLFRLAKDIILANSERPLYAIVGLGFAISVVAFLIGIITLVRYFLGFIDVVGYASLIVSIWFLGGVIILILGVLGLYIGKTFEAVKDRPIYIVKSTINSDD